uniref:Rad60/SUMO-like domain-containing protein n=1 Tax=Romanomermis culicivorax TaxID=13658 RepID=A0A915HRY3_ROMCU
MPQRNKWTRKRIYAKITNFRPKTTERTLNLMEKNRLETERDNCSRSLSLNSINSFLKINYKHQQELDHPFIKSFYIISCKLLYRSLDICEILKIGQSIAEKQISWYFLELASNRYYSFQKKAGRIMFPYCWRTDMSSVKRVPLKKLKRLDPKIMQKCVELAASSDDSKLQKWHENVFNSKGFVQDINRAKKSTSSEPNGRQIVIQKEKRINELNTGKFTCDVVNVSEDDCDDCDNQSVQSTSSAPDRSFINSEIDEKFIIWIKADGAQLSRFEIGKDEKFGVIFDQFCRKIGVTADSVCFFYHFDLIGFRDTPISLSVPNFSIIEAKIIRSSSIKIIVEKDVNMIQLKFQTQDLRNATNVLKVNKDEKFGEIKTKYLNLRSDIKSESESIIFSFDGAVIPHDSTPKILELEELDCIDVIQRL